MIDDVQSKTLPDRLRARIDEAPHQVWTPADFADIGGRGAVDKALQRMVTSGQLRRIERGLYDKPSQNALTGKSTVPDYRAVIDAVARRDQVRWVVDGMTAANTLGLTNAVPAKIEVLVDARLKPVTLGNQKIVFKHAAPSRLYWAGRPCRSGCRTFCVSLCLMSQRKIKDEHGRFSKDHFGERCRSC